MTPTGATATSSEHRSIYSLISAHAAKTPDAAAILAPGRRPLTYRGLLAQMEKVGRTLNEMGLGCPDRIAAVLPNGPEAAVAYLAIASTATFAPLNPACQAREFDQCFSDLNVRALILQAGTQTAARDVALTLGIPVIELSQLTEVQAGLFELRGPLRTLPRPVSFAGPSDDAVAMYTSGTTARPKLVLHTQASVCLGAYAIADSLELTASDRCLNVLSPFHFHCLDAGILASLAAGAGVICTPGFDAAKFLEWITGLRPTWYSAAPAVHLAALAAAISIEDIIKRTALRFVRSSSSTLPFRLKADFERVFGVPVIESYGMTEVGPITSERHPPWTRKAGSAGQSVGPEVSIMDAAGHLLPAGQTGEIVVQGPTVMRGYENDPAANRAAFTNGWFRTGDQGAIDSEGFLFITARLKEIIDRGGEKISPQEVDQVLMEHPAVREVATFPLPDRRLGEEVAAAVVLKSGTSATEAELIRYASERLASYKVPRRFILCNEIPKGPTRKVQRATLAKQLDLAEAGSLHDDQEKERPQWQQGPEAMLTALWEKILGVGPIGLHDNFFEMGGDSLAATRVLAWMKDTFDVSLPPAMFHGEPTVTGLTRALFGELSTKPLPTLVPLQPNGSGHPFFMVTPAHAWGLFEMARRLGDDRPFYVLHSHEFAGVDWARIEIEKLAAYYVRQMRRVQLKGPYLIGGVSAGGVVALEMAQQLLAEGQQVGALVMIDTPYGKMFLRRAEYTGPLWRRWRAYLLMCLRVAGVPPLADMSTPVRWLRNLLHPPRPAREKSCRPESEPVEEFWTYVLRGITAHIHAVRRHRVKPYPGEILYFWARDTRLLGLGDPRRGWNRVARGGVTVHEIPGHHHEVMMEPHVQLLALKLRAYLAHAEEAAKQAGSR